MRIDALDQVGTMRTPGDPVKGETVINRSTRTKKMSRRTYLRILLASLWLLAVGESLYSQNVPKRTTQDFEWGSVATANDGKGLSVTVSVKPSPIKELAGIVQQSADSAQAKGNRTIHTEPAFPQFSFFMAIPPNTNLRSGTINVHSINANPDDRIVLTGYRSATDSSGLSAVYQSAAQAGSIPADPVLAVVGYEWYRGYKLARLVVSPYQQQGSDLRLNDKIETRFDFQPDPQFSGVIRESLDPHFDAILNRLIANASDLPSAGQTNLVAGDSTGTWIPWGQPAVKLGIAQDGVYRLTFQHLQSLVSGAGLIDPTTFRLFNRGKEISLYVEGENDNQFSQSDYIEFPALRNYGLKDYHLVPSGDEEYPEYFNRYTDTSVYWLTWGGPKGLRMDSTSLVPSSTDTLSWYTELVHIEQNTQLQFADGSDLVVRQDPRWTSGDIWGWGWLAAGGSFDASFTVSNLYTGFPTARISAKCASTTWPFGTPSYKVRLRVNSSDTLQKVDDNGQTPQILLRADAPIASLLNGTNTIHVHSLATPSSVNSIWFDWAEAEYPRNLVAIGDTLIFGFPLLTSPGIKMVSISGLSTPNVVVYKYAPRMKRITNVTTTGAGSYTLTFSDTVSPGDRYMLWGSAGVKSPSVIGIRTFPNLRDVTRGADYVLITSKQFAAIASQYAAFIGSTYNLRTTIVDVEEIFNEFGYGYPTAESIREFLKTTSSWQAPMPSYVVLVGDGTYDHKYYVANSNPQNRPLNAVPPYGEPVSDPWLAVLDDASIIPQMYIGRIPVSTQAEFTRYFDRVRSYVAAPNDDWNKRYMFFAGGEFQTAGQIELFHHTNESIITSMVNPAPIGGVALDFYKTATPRTDYGPYSFDQVQNMIDGGAVSINYVGHGATTSWDNNIRLITQLKNTRNRYSLISDFGCSTAKFAEPDIKCFGELFTLDPDGSSIAFVGNSALGFISVAISMPALFYKQFLVNQIYPIGKAHLLGKIEEMNQTGGPTSLLNRAMMLTNSLIGDPSIELAIPKKPNLLVSSGAVSAIPAIPSDDQDSLKLILPYMNTGRVIQDSMNVKLRHTYNNVTADTLIKRKIPLFRDTLVAAYPIKDRAGDHTFTIEFNPDGRIQELQRNDNTTSYSTAVLSTSLKAVRPLPNYESPQVDFVMLNPTRKVSDISASVTLQLDTTEAFSTPVSISKPFGFVSTKIPLPTLQKDRTYHWRANVSNSPSPAVRGSFVLNPVAGTRWHSRDSSSWKLHSFENTKYFPGVGTMIQDRMTSLHVESSGYSDGAVGAVLINGANVLTSRFSRGHTVVLLDTIDFSVKDIQIFDTFGSRAQVDALGSYLSALPTGSLIIELIIDEGWFNLTPSVRSAIRSFGSIYIDSLQYRDSWAIIGRKGATPGSVPERWKSSSSGKAVIDTIITRKVSTGTVTSPEIGPVGNWNSMSFSGNKPSGTAIMVNLLGIRPNGTVDTLQKGQTKPTTDLTSYSPVQYPKMKLLANLTANAIGQSAVLADWSVDVDLPGELAVNYQSVTASADSVLEGDNVTLQAAVCNVGSVAVDSIVVRVQSLGSGGLQLVDSTVVARIPADSSQSVTFTVPTAGKRGMNTLFVEVDPRQRIIELYKSNNVYSLPLFVRTDTARPAFDVVFDGRRIYDGDYVSSVPTIHVDIYDNSPLPMTNPSNVLLFLDSRRVSLGSSPDSLFETLTGTEKAHVTYRPQLSKGDHKFSIQVKDVTGNFADTTARIVLFKVETESRLLNVFNFPNPFGVDTYFTFNLVGARLPDELKIKIYSLAGRLLREILVARGDLNFGFNRVHWDGRDTDGDELANGVYFYKVSMRIDDKSEEVIQKMAKMR